MNLTISNLDTPFENSFTVICHVCGIPSSREWARKAQSRPTSCSKPYFPFLTQIRSLGGAGPFSWEDGSAYLCAFCHASLEAQWSLYEDQQVVPPPHRKYNILKFICAVCGVQTYRKRIRALPFQEFPFLEKQRQPGSNTLGNNLLAVVCLDCSETLWAQSAEYDRWGLPVQKRHFNWMARPPPPENSMEATVARLPSGETQLPRCPPVEPEILAPKYFPASDKFGTPTSLTRSKLKPWSPRQDDEHRTPPLTQTSRIPSPMSLLPPGIGMEEKFLTNYHQELPAVAAGPPLSSHSSIISYRKVDTHLVHGAVHWPSSPWPYWPHPASEFSRYQTPNQNLPYSSDILEVGSNGFTMATPHNDMRLASKGERSPKTKGRGGRTPANIQDTPVKLSKRDKKPTNDDVKHSAGEIDQEVCYLPDPNKVTIPRKDSTHLHPKKRRILPPSSKKEFERVEPNCVVDTHPPCIPSAVVDDVKSKFNGENPSYITGPSRKITSWEPDAAYRASVIKCTTAVQISAQSAGPSVQSEDTRENLESGRVSTVGENFQTEKAKFTVKIPKKQLSPRIEITNFLESSSSSWKRLERSIHDLVNDLEHQTSSVSVLEQKQYWIDNIHEHLRSRSAEIIEMEKRLESFSKEMVKAARDKCIGEPK